MGIRLKRLSSPDDSTPTTGTSRCLDFGDAQGGQHSEILRAQLVSGGQQFVAGGQVLAGLDDVLAGGGRAQDFDGGFVDRLGVFHHDHGVGPGRQHAAGVDELGGTGLHGPFGGGTHRNLAVHGQECG